MTRLINCLLALGALLSACNRRNETIRALEADGCHVEYFDSGCAYVDLYGLWLDDLRSEKLTAMVTKLAKEDVCMLGLRSCAEDEHLKIVARSSKLWGLDLTATNVTAQGLRELTRLKLSTLYLVNCPNVDDKAIKAIAPIRTLKLLHIEGTHVSDKSIPILGTFTDLDRLFVSAPITEEGAARLRKLLPNTKVHGRHLSRAAESSQ